MKKNILLINYRNMGVGGIENYIYHVIKTALREEYEVIWLCDTHPIIAPIYESFFDTEKIKKIPCETHGFHWFRHGDIVLSQYSRIIVISFNFLDHVRALEFLKDCECAEKYPLFLIPHYEGGLLFPETNFKRIKKIVRKIAAKGYSSFIESGEVIFMASNHPDAIEKAYGIKIEEKNKKRAPSFINKREFDEERIRHNYRNDVFTIIAAGRLEFPHKGYILGLIDVFCQLKNKYSFLRLRIIGDGIDKNILLKKLESLPQEIRADIKYEGMIPYDQLLDVYEKCNLSISIAGCATSSAMVGLLTLPARNYTEECEVYGFIPDSKNMTTSTEPGKPVREYIEQVIRMTEEEYVQRSRLSYECYEDSSVSIANLYSLLQSNTPYYPTKKDLYIYKILNFLEKVNYFVKAL